MLGLDNNQQALLEIADEPTPKAQMRAVKEIVARKRAGCDRNASAAATDKKTTAEIDALDADIRQKEGDLERLKRDLASDRKRRQELDDKLAVQGQFVDASHTGTVGDEGRSPKVTPDTAVGQEQEELHDEEEQEQEEQEWEEEDQQDQEQVPSPSTVPTDDEGIPAFLDRRPLSAKDQLTFDTIWGALQTASAVVRERIRAALNKDINCSNSAAE
jgi:hypothetical protein